MAWITPRFSRSHVDAAGRTLVATEEALWAMERESALEVINNWRSSHAFPLQGIKMTLLNRARKVDPNALIAQRIKRLTSIAAKLTRQESMKLSRMHDIGGCRAVVANVADVDDLIEIYTKSRPAERNEFVHGYDYIDEPKLDGYRGIHLVYKYRTASPDRKKFEGLRIEIQLRSQLQHAWATAIETVSTITGQTLKSNIGSDDWKRFFVLMGSAIALKEQSNLVPGTPTTKQELADEIRELDKQLKIARVLATYGAVVETFSEKAAGVGYPQYLIVLNSITRELRVTAYGKTELAKASDDYLLAEKEIEERPELQAVLVSVDSLTALRKAYPNYWLDTTAFLATIDDVLSNS